MHGWKHKRKGAVYDKIKSSNWFYQKGRLKAKVYLLLESAKGRKQSKLI